MEVEVRKQTWEKMVGFRGQDKISDDSKLEALATRRIRIQQSSVDMRKT